jgi:hypothetical protein
VLIFDREGGPTLAGAIELIDPANKHRPEHREAFVNECAASFQRGLGLVTVDVVTGRRVNLHRKLLARFGAGSLLSRDVEFYATSHRPVERDAQPGLEFWHEPFATGEPMPSLPLSLRVALCLQVDLDGTYDRTCREQRILVGA